MLFTPPRKFNQLVDLGDHYLKLSENHPKIVSEYLFYKSIPQHLLEFFPKISDDLFVQNNLVGYKIKKIPTPDSSFHILKDKDPIPFFENFFNLISNYFDRQEPLRITKEESIRHLENEIFEKDYERLQMIAKLPIWDWITLYLDKNVSSSPKKYLKNIHDAILLTHSLLNEFSYIFSHGDLCLSNTLVFDNQLFLIDPKGISHNKQNLRTPYYDYAKLSQCFLGMYDYINLGYFEIINDRCIIDHIPKNTTLTQNLFREFINKYNLNLKFILAIQASFFFSMIPLHSESEEKMKAFLIQSIESWRISLEH